MLWETRRNRTLQDRQWDSLVGESGSLGKEECISISTEVPIDNETFILPGRCVTEADDRSGLIDDGKRIG